MVVGMAYGSIWYKLKTHRDKLNNHKGGGGGGGGGANNRQGSVRKAKTPESPQPGGSKAAKVTTNNETTAMQTLLPKSANNNKELKVESNQATRTSCVVTTQNPTTPGVSGLERTNTIRSNESRRRLKMNVLLTFIAIIFAASWLPLNLFNILSDSKISIIKPSPTYYIINAVCILFGMSSAVSNPFLYGFLNENFKREYNKLFHALVSRFPCLRRRGTEQPPGPGGAGAGLNRPNTARKEPPQQQIVKKTVADSQLGNRIVKFRNNDENIEVGPVNEEQNRLIGNPIIRINSENISENNMV
jgi:hypothetical protein